MMKKMLLAFAVASLGASSASHAAVLYSTDFKAPTYADGTLVPVALATDTTTPGQDGWLNSSGGLTNPIQVSDAASSGIVTIGTTGQDVRHTFAPVTAGSVYLTAAVNITAAQANGDYFIHLGDGGTSNFYGRTFAKSTTGGFHLAVNTSSGGTPAPTYGAALPFGAHTLLLKYDIVAGTANDTATLFVNPTTADGSGDTAYVTATNIGADATSIAGVYLRQGSATNAPSLTVDSLSVDVIPEPTTLAALAGMGLVAFRRRRA